MTIYLFPSSECLSTKWWHRLALVIFWGWVIFAIAAAAGYLIFFLKEIYEEGHASYTAIFFILGALITPLIPSISYRIILYITMNNSWKSQ